MDASKSLGIAVILLGLIFGCCWAVQVHGNDEQHCIYSSLANAVAENGSLEFDVNGLATVSVKAIRVDQFGGKGDGKSDDTMAFVHAWKVACASSVPTAVVVPKGKIYVVKPVAFSGPCHSPLTMKVSGTILAPTECSVWNGLNPKLWLHFDRVEGLTVEGGGTIDGSGQNWWARSCKINEANPCRPAPTAVTFRSCNDLKVGSLSVKNGQQMHVAFDDCVGVHVRNLNVASPGNSPNTDGIHVSNTKNVLIQKSSASTGDDCISIASGSSDILVKNFICGPGHGISIGSLGEGGSEAKVSNVTVDGASLHGTTNGVRIKTWPGGSGYARDITFENVQMRNVKNPIIIDQFYCDPPKPCVNKASAVKVSNVVYRNIEGTTPTKDAVQFNCSKSVPCENILQQNVHFDFISNGKEELSENCRLVGTSTTDGVIQSLCT